MWHRTDLPTAKSGLPGAPARTKVRPSLTRMGALAAPATPEEDTAAPRSRATTSPFTMLESCQETVIVGWASVGDGHLAAGCACRAGLPCSAR